MGNLQDKYVYAMLKELYPQEEYPSFRWNEIPDDDYEKSKFVDIVTDIFYSLKAVLDKMVQKSMMNIVQGAKLRLEIAKIEKNRGNWRYALNIRGFILYLLGEIESEKNRKGNPEKKARVHNIRISKVLENLSEHNSKEFPFLLHYSDFKNEYARLADLGEVQKNFEIKLLKEIA
jgi:hypothetical protein